MKAGKTILSATILVALLFIQSCQKETKKTETTGVEEISTGPNTGGGALAATATQIDVYGVWHAGNDFCIWGTPRSASEFDTKNHWLIDRGNGQPSINLVILS